MSKIKTISELVYEKRIPEPSIDPSEFPNPVTQAMSKLFLQKGLKDGDLKDDIVKTQRAKFKAKELFPSQMEIFLSKSLGMAILGVIGGNLDAIISKDNFILDGHHRWCSTMFGNPDAEIEGLRVDMTIENLIPVLRAVGDAFGNQRRGKPKGGDKNVFVATKQDVINAINGENMNMRFYDKDKAMRFLAENEGELGKRLEMIQEKKPSGNALPRTEMPVIDPKKGELKVVGDLFRQGKIDVAKPYGNVQ